MAIDCNKFNSFLFRRVPDFDKELAKDRFPFNYLYTNMYPSQPFSAFTGFQHTWDRVHVTRPNDDGNWDTVNSNDCAQNICDYSRVFTGWGSTRSTYGIFHRDYQSPVFCYDQLRHVEEAVEQLSAIVDGHKELPDSIISDFLRLLAVKTSNVIWICGSADNSVTTTDAMFTFTNGTLNINLGGTGNLPDSKLSVQYLNNHVENLIYNGYFKKDFMPQGKFLVTADFQTQTDLTNANPSLSQMYNAADIVKGGKFFDYGVMSGVGPWLFKVDPEPMRFQHIGSGILRRILPYQNVATTVGKMPQFDTAYKNAEYQMFHVYNRATRMIEVGDLAPVNPEMKFNTARSMMGKWSWKSPDYFRAVDPNTGTVCEYQNDKKNKGYFLAEFEMGTKTVYPEMEMIIIAKREPQGVVSIPRCAASPSMVYQSLTPYNGPLCES